MGIIGIGKRTELKDHIRRPVVVVVRIARYLFVIIPGICSPGIKQLRHFGLAYSFRPSDITSMQTLTLFPIRLQCSQRTDFV